MSHPPLLSLPLATRLLAITLASLIFLAAATPEPPSRVAAAAAAAAAPAAPHSAAFEAGSSPVDGKVRQEEGFEEESEPVRAVLFPWFASMLGVFVYWVLTRYIPAVPYTAVMFIIGTFMGVGTVLLYPNSNHISESLWWWIPINSEVLLLIFLPGLIFKDATHLNIHLFQASFTQLFLFAFPMVLAGTALTAILVYHIFPYDWSFNLCMTFGSILSATDPVAVAALLDAVGAPPRLKMHISGESLLNDGSAIVFFTIFSGLYLLETGLPGLGEDYTWGSGIVKFLRMSLGGMMIGIFFGLGLVFCLWILDRRLSREENIVQVAASITVAYLCYYVADAVWGTSGVIATLTAGLTTSVCARAFLSDNQLYEDFLALVEHLLNTVLFTLGGLVWGSIIANSDERVGVFDARDWGFLFVLYLLLTLIRYFLFAAFYPVVSRIGIKSSIRELVFQSWGGLRGAVGIALAIVLDNEVASAELPSDNPVYSQQTNKLFGFVGGIAFLTLVINATAAGPILKKLGLVDPTPVRKEIVACYHTHGREYTIQKMLKLLTQPRFHDVNYTVVREHVSLVEHLTKEELFTQLEIFRRASQDGSRAPKLDGFWPYLDEAGPDKVADVEHERGSEMMKEIMEDLRASLPMGKVAQENIGSFKRKIEIAMTHKKNNVSAAEVTSKETDGRLIELRRIFLEIVRRQYDEMAQAGELYRRDFTTLALDESLAFAADRVNLGEPLQDWAFTSVLDVSLMTTLSPLQRLPVIKSFTHAHELDDVMRTLAGSAADGQRLPRYEVVRTHVDRTLSFLYAHRRAQEILQREFVNSAEFSEYEKQVLQESVDECNAAEEYLGRYPRAVVGFFVNHKFCQILLSFAARYVKGLNEGKLLQDPEAEEFMEEITEELADLAKCAKHVHAGEVQTVEEKE